MKLKKKEIGYLAYLKKRQKARILKINISNPIVKRRLLDMGLTKGTEVIIKKVAPLGDPIIIELRGYELCIRKKDLLQVVVEVI